MAEVNDLMQGSVALQFVISQGWTWKLGVAPNIELETCPYCKKPGFGHFYMECHGPADDQKSRDGLFYCQRCGQGGNLFSLKQKLGLVSSDASQFSSQKEWATDKKQDPLPDVQAAHEALLADADALEYLMTVRGFSRAIIERQKLGLVPEMRFRKAGKAKALVYPYLVNGNIVWAHYRTLPDINDLARIPKDFVSPTGWDSRLYNEPVLKEGLKEVVLVEGEANCIAAMDHGIGDICGIPGAANRKAEWIDTFAKIGVEKIYICYDRDKAGQKGAQEIASRIGIEHCWKIMLPEFEVTTEAGLKRPGKDLNEWFAQGGGTKEKFDALKAEAVLFDVDGVAGVRGAVDEFLEELEGRDGAGQRYNYPLWKHMIQFDEGDCVDIMAEEKVGKTTVGLLLMDHMVRTYNETGVVICLEMTRAKLARKWVCQRTGIADYLPTTPEEARALKAEFLTAIPALKEEVAKQDADLLFCYPKYNSAEDIYKLIIDCIRRYGAKWIMFDNLQRLCDTTIGERNRTQYLSEISKNLSQICKDYHVQMFRIVQPHQIGQGRVLSVRDADGSSQIAKDSDAMITLYRARVGDTMSKDDLQKQGYIQSNESFKPEMLVTVGNSRYSSGGQDQFYFNGATGQLLPLAEGRIAAMNAARGPVGYQEQAVARNMPEVAAAVAAYQNVTNEDVPV